MANALISMGGGGGGGGEDWKGAAIAPLTPPSYSSCASIPIPITLDQSCNANEWKTLPSDLSWERVSNEPLSTTLLLSIKRWRHARTSSISVNDRL